MNYLIYEANSRASVSELANRKVSNISSVAYHGKLIINDEITYKDESEALNALNLLCAKTRLDNAVKYVSKTPLADTVEIKDLITITDAIESDKKAFIKANDVCNPTQKFILCNNCDSKISRHWLGLDLTCEPSNVCPVCHEDMRPISVINTLSYFDTLASDINDKIDWLRGKNSINSDEKWLVKISAER